MTLHLSVIIAFIFFLYNTTNTVKTSYLNSFHVLNHINS
ncbi:hypothetical protein BJQ96_01200 [Flavobacterium sp. PL0002]|nr:hypothetical protein [Flavobacterium sp. PL002]